MSREGLLRRRRLVLFRRACHKSEVSKTHMSNTCVSQHVSATHVKHLCQRLVSATHVDMCGTTHNTQHTTHNTQHTTHNTQHTHTQHTTHNTQHTTHNTQHTTHNTQHTTHNTQHTTHNKDTHVKHLCQPTCVSHTCQTLVSTTCVRYSG